MIEMDVSSQILIKFHRDRKHDRFPPKGGLVRELPLFQGNLGW